MEAFLEKLDKDLETYFGEIEECDLFCYEKLADKVERYLRDKNYRKSEAQCLLCKRKMTRSQLYYHYKKVHNTTAKNLQRKQDVS
jgi:hypothetical protein